MAQNHLKVVQDASQQGSGKKFKVKFFSGNEKCECISGPTSSKDSEAMFQVLTKLISVLQPSAFTQGKVVNGANGARNANGAEMVAPKAIINNDVLTVHESTSNSFTANIVHATDVNGATNGISTPGLQTNPAGWESENNVEDMEVDLVCDFSLIQAEALDDEANITTANDANSEASADSLRLNTEQELSDMAEVLVSSAEAASNASISIEDEIDKGSRISISSENDDVGNDNMETGISGSELDNEDLNDVGVDDCVELDAVLDTLVEPNSDQQPVQIHPSNQLQSAAVNADIVVDDGNTSQADDYDIIDLTKTSPPRSPQASANRMQLQPSPKVKIHPQESQQSCLAESSRASCQVDASDYYKPEPASTQELNAQPSNPMSNFHYFRPPFSEARPNQVLQDTSLHSVHGGYQNHGHPSRSQSEFGDSNAQFRDDRLYSNHTDADPSKPYIPMQSPNPGPQSVMQNLGYASAPPSNPGLPLSPRTMTSFAAHAASFPVPSGYSTPIVVQNIFVFPSAPPQNNQRLQ